MDNLHLLYDAYYKGFQQYDDLYLPVTINDIKTLELYLQVH